MPKRLLRSTTWKVFLDDSAHPPFSLFYLPCLPKRFVPLMRKFISKALQPGLVAAADTAGAVVEWD